MPSRGDCENLGLGINGLTGRWLVVLDVKISSFALMHVYTCTSTHTYIYIYMLNISWTVQLQDKMMQ